RRPEVGRRQRRLAGKAESKIKSRIWIRKRRESKSKSRKTWPGLCPALSPNLALPPLPNPNPTLNLTPLVRGQASCTSGRLVGKGHALRRADPLPRNVLRIPLAEHPEAGPTARTGRGPPLEPPRLGDGQAQERGRPAVRRRTRDGNDARPGVRLRRGGAKSGRAGRAGLAHPGRRAADARGGGGDGGRGRVCCWCSAATRGSTSGSAWG